MVVLATAAIGGLGITDGAFAVPTDDAAALEQQANRAFEIGDGEAAIALYRRAIDAVDDAEEGLRLALIIALLEHDRGRDAAAINTLTEALIEVPDHRLPPGYGDAFASIYRTAKDRAIITRRNRALEYVARATEDMRNGRNELARDALERALRLAPDTPTAIYNLAYLDLRTGRDQEALAGFERLIAQGSRPDGQSASDALRGQALVNLGYLYSRREQHAEAATALEEAVTLVPDSADAWLNLGLAQVALDEADDAGTAFERANALRPNDPAIVRHVAETRLRTGDRDAARALLEAAAARHPGDAALHYSLGSAREGSGADARGAFEAALAADPDDASGFGALAALKLARADCDAGDARACAERGEQALAMRPSWVDALAVIAEARRVLGDLAGAQDALERAVSVDPTRADLHNNLGDIYCRSHDVVRAVEAFQRALAIQPDLAAATENLAAVEVSGCR